MSSRRRLLFFAALLLPLCGSPAPAQLRSADSVPADPATRRFAARVVAATDADDLARLKSLIHPRCLPCVAADDSGFFDDYFKRIFMRDIPPTYKVWQGAVKAGAPLLLEDALTYPVRPSGYFEIGYETGAYSGATIREYTVVRGGRLFLVVPCPKPETLRKFREMKAAGRGAE